MTGFHRPPGRRVFPRLLPGRVPRLLLTAVLGCAVFSMSSAASAAAPARPKAAPSAAKAAPHAAVPKGDPVAGAEKSDSERCQECHGNHGQGSQEGRFARLAGQHPDYIIKQVEAFRSGARKNDIMAIMAKSVTDEDLRDIAAYFASQKPVSGDGKGLSAGAKALYANGDAVRGIPACASCHGEAGKGSTSAALTYPAISGQEFHYLEKQLLDWRAGLRADSPDGVMVRISKALTEAEITALSNHLSSLP